MKNFAVVVVAALLALPRVASASEKSVAEKLARGWKEYNLAEFAAAEDWFEQASEEAETDKEFCEAMTGLAFCSQYALKQAAGASDYQRAIGYYDKALKRVGADSKYTPFILAMIAECSYNIHKLSGDAKALATAEMLWAKIADKWPNTLAAQDALLFQVISCSDGEFISPKAASLADKLKRYLERDEEAGAKSKSARSVGLRAVMYNYLADFRFWNGDYETAVRWLERYCDLGPTSYSAKADALFKIARIADLKLLDRKKAMKYYAKFIKEIQSDSRRYLARQRLKELNRR